jgi:hypothetical protein
MVSDSKPSLAGARRKPVDSSQITHRWPTSVLSVKVGIAWRPEAPIVNAIVVVTRDLGDTRDAAGGDVEVIRDHVGVG